MNLEDYPIGTKAHASGGGYWTKTEHGWQWCTGDTFPRPGGDAIRYEVPNKTVELTPSMVRLFCNMLYRDFKSFKDYKGS